MDQTADDHPLNPLEWFYRTAGRPAPAFEAVAADALPDPYRQLLAHERDMTSTLEAFVGQTLSLTVLQSHAAGDCLHRKVVLSGDDDQVLAEFGAIRIHVDRLGSETARAEVEAGERPLGAILRAHGVTHRCRPTGFFRVRCDATMRRVLGVTDDRWLYGRNNILYNGDDVVLAEVTEILPAL